MKWDPAFLSRSPMLAPLRLHAPAFGPRWPALADWQEALDARDPVVRNAQGRALRAVAPLRRRAALEERYEARVYLEGELEVRAESWHDCFNVLAWLAFPRAKAALNARHYRALIEQRTAGAVNRGPAQDALTLFDEGGVIVAAADPDLLDCVRAFRWKALFRENRARLAQRARFYLFGHALCEKALRPFVGVTGRTILLEVDDALLAAPPAAQLAAFDARIAAHIADPRRLTATRELGVLPILGVPGWYAGNENEAFYDNTDYFRPHRRAEKRE